MAGDSEKRKSWFDEEEDSDVAALKNRNKSTSGTEKKIGGPVAPTSAAAKSAIAEAEVSDLVGLLEQTHQLYQQYFNGVERRPPVEKHQMLEKNLNHLLKSSKTAMAKFKAQQLHQQFTTYREMWMRKLKERERK